MWIDTRVFNIRQPNVFYISPKLKSIDTDVYSCVILVTEDPACLITFFLERDHIKYTVYLMGLVWALCCFPRMCAVRDLPRTPCAPNRAADSCVAPPVD